MICFAYLSRTGMESFFSQREQSLSYLSPPFHSVCPAGKAGFSGMYSGKYIIMTISYYPLQRFLADAHL